MKPLFIIFFSLLLPACSSLGYYLELANGHAQILNQAEPISEVLKQPAISPAVKQALQQVVAAREFAQAELLLPDNGSYHEYADIKRPYVVWNVIATPPWSITPRKWCFAIVGCISYRGFFSQHKADAFAETLRQQGDDVYVAGVRAYSTLGWFSDPVLNTMLYRDELEQVSLIFHEMAHQKIYVKNDTQYNESFATAVAEEGVRRWLEKYSKPEQFGHYQEKKRYRQAFNRLLMDSRQQLAALYEKDLPATVRAEKKRAIFARLKKDYQTLKANWGNNPRYDNWMAQELNNAHLAIIATYHDLVPLFRQMLTRSGGDLEDFYRLAQDMTKLSKQQRKQKLLTLNP